MFSISLQMWSLLNNFFHNKFIDVIGISTNLVFYLLIGVIYGVERKQSANIFGLVFLIALSVFILQNNSLTFL